MKWTIRYLREAEEDLNRLDGSVSREVRKAIEKLKTDPENFGKALGHKQVNLNPLNSHRRCRYNRHFNKPSCSGFLPGKLPELS